MQPPSSFFDTTPPTRTMARCESDSKILRHTRSFSKFLFFGGPKNKEDERLVEDMASPQRKNHKKSHKRTGGAQFSFPDVFARDASQSTPSSKSTSKQASLLFSSSTRSTSSNTTIGTPTRPPRPEKRPPLSIFTSRDPFIDDLSPSPTRTRILNPKLSISQLASSRTKEGSTESDASSPGPQTPFEDALSLGQFSVISKNLYSGLRSQRMPEISSAPLQRNPTAPILEVTARTFSQPVTPIKKSISHGVSHSVDWRFASTAKGAHHLRHHAHSYSVSNDPGPLASLLDEEYASSALPTPMGDSPSAPTLRHALLLQQEKYRALQRQLHEAESAKEERDRKIVVMQEEADKRVEEVRGLRLLLAAAEKSHNHGDTDAEVEVGSPLTRCKSMPFLGAPTHDVDVPSSARPGETFDNPSSQGCKPNLGLGIDLDRTERETERAKSKRYGKAMMRPPPCPAPRTKPPTPSAPTIQRSRSVSKRSKDVPSSTNESGFTLAVPVAPLNICRKKDAPRRRIDPLVGVEQLSRELKRLKTSNDLCQK